METINAVKCYELDDNKAGGYKQRGRQTERLTDRWKESGREERMQQPKKRKKTYSISVRDPFSENLLKQYSTYYW